MPEFSPAIIVYYLVALALGVWVLFDGRTRLAGRPSWEPLAWGLGTSLALPIFLPMYLLGARSPDRSGVWGGGEMLGIAIFFGLTLPLVAGLLRVHEGGLTLREVSVVVLVQNAGFVLLGIFGILVRYRLPAARLGLTTKRWARRLLFGVAVGVLMIPVATVAEKVAVDVAALVEGRPAALARAEREHQSDPLDQILGVAQEPAAVAWLVVLLAVIVPLGEELYFRGIVYGGLRARYSLGWGLMGSTLFFGVVHRQVIHFLPIALLGLALALVYERTRSLLPAIAVHAVNNVISVLARVYGWNI